MELITPRTPATPIGTQQAPSTNNGDAKPGGIPGQISEQDALKGGDKAAMSTVSLDRIGDAAAAGNQVSLGSLIEAKLALEIIDSLLPAAIVIIFHAAKIQLNKSVFQLTAKEKDTLAPILQKCMESVNLNFDSPWTALMITAGAIYTAKVFEHGGKAVIDRNRESKKVADKTPSEIEVAQAAKVRKEKQKVKDAEAIPELLREWDEDDVQKVITKRRKGRIDALDWLAKNWVKKGGVI